MKKCIRMIMILCCFMITMRVIIVESFAENKVIGNAVYSNITAYINNNVIPSYNINGYTGIIAEDLEQYGFDVHYDNKQRCLSITYNEQKEITANNKINKKPSGTFAYHLYESDIIVKINGKVVPHYSENIFGENVINISNIGGKTMILINCLEEYGSIIWSACENEIYFRYIPAWQIEINSDTPKQKQKEILNFNVELTKNELGEFHIKGENIEYLNDFRIIYYGEGEKLLNINTQENGFWTINRKTPYSCWFRNNKINFEFSISEEDKAMPLLQKLYHIITINSEGNVVENNIAAANEQIQVFINGEKVSVTAVELEPYFYHSIYHFELDKEIRSLNEVQTITIECK